MDWIYNAVDACNMLLKKGILVLNRSMLQDSRMKVYKNFRYSLNIVQGKENVHNVFTLSYKEHCPSAKIEETWHKCDMMFMVEFYTWLSSDGFLKYRRDGI